MAADNLHDALNAEIVRNKELLIEYERIPEGKLGAMIIKLALRGAELAIQEQDLPKMIYYYNELKGSQ